MPAVKPDDVESSGKEREESIPATVKLDDDKMEIGRAIRHLHDRIDEVDEIVVDSRAHQGEVPVGEAVVGAENNIEKIYEQLFRQGEQLEEQGEQIEELRNVIERLMDFLVEADVFNVGSEAIEWENFDEGE